MLRSKIDEGRKGEDAAVAFLEKQGYRIIDRNFRIRGGEIDIIAIDSSNPREQILVFIEVKTRSSTDFGTPLEAITYWKLKALIKTAQFYKAKYPKLPDLMRIDAVAVALQNGEVSKIDLVKNIS